MFSLKLKWLDASTNNNDAISDIQKWIVESGVPHCHVDKLLNIINVNWMPTIPRCTATLLNCNAKFNIRSMKASTGSTGEYVYFGLQNKLQSMIKEDWHLSDVLEIILFLDVCLLSSLHLQRFGQY